MLTVHSFFFHHFKMLKQIIFQIHGVEFPLCFCKAGIHYLICFDILVWASFAALYKPNRYCLWELQYTVDSDKLPCCRVFTSGLDDVELYQLPFEEDERESCPDCFQQKEGFGQKGKENEER